MGGKYMEERQMHKAVCAKCGKGCEVPFKPTEGKDVLCQDCFRQNRPRRSFGGNNRSFGNRRDNRPPRQMHKAVCAKCKNDCEVPFKPTPGKEVLCQDCFRKNNVGRF